MVENNFPSYSQAKINLDREMTEVAFHNPQVEYLEKLFPEYDWVIFEKKSDAKGKWDFRADVGMSKRLYVRAKFRTKTINDHGFEKRSP